MAVPTGPAAGAAAEGFDAPVVPDLTGPPTRRLRTSVASVGVVTLIAKLILTGKDLAVARAFGTTSDLDVFLLAFALSQFAMTVIAGSFATSVVPTFIEVREREGRQAATDLFARSFAEGLRVLVGAALVLAVAGPLLLTVLVPDRSGSGPRLATALFFLLLPTLLLNGMSVAWAAILGAEERYTESVAPQILAPIAPLLAVLAMSDGAPDVRWLAVATSIGFAIEAAATGLLLHRRGIPIRPRKGTPTEASRTVVKQFLPVAAGSCMMASTLLVDQAMSVRLAPGSVAALSFGGKAVGFLTTVGALPLTTAALPHFSRLATDPDRRPMVGALVHWVKLILLVSVPITVVMIAFSEPLVAIVFQRGAFTAADTEVVARVQQLFLLQLPAYLLGVVLVRVISAIKANVVLLWGAGLNLVVNVGLNLLFGSWFGVSGIALSTSAVYWVSAGFLALMLVRRLPVRQPRSVASDR